MLSSSAALDAGDTVVSKTASSFDKYFSVKGEITKQIRVRSSSHRPSLTHTHGLHKHVHTYTRTHMQAPYIVKP